MAEIRLSKLIKQFNIGLGDLVVFLQKQGLDIDENPNAKVSDEYLPAISKQFGGDLAMKEAAEKVDIKIAEILEKSGRRSERGGRDDEEPERESIIKTNTIQREKAVEPGPAPKVKEEPKPAPKAEPEPEPAPKPDPN